MGLNNHEMKFSTDQTQIPLASCPGPTSQPQYSDIVRAAQFAHKNRRLCII